ncbi:MAG: hypothetical protein COB38_12570 [Gammaproteobacteria bacterium]|nr:MAG: hypothetical protein COB38_12570 [Gammaproteobacteria bacterium]
MLMKLAKDEFLQIRLSSKQKESIRNAAKMANADMSSWILSKVLNSQSDDFLKVIEKLVSSQQQSYIYAEIHDLLMKCDHNIFGETVKLPPTAQLNSFQLNYITAMVEHRAMQLSEKTPNWCSEINSLKKPHFGSNLKCLKLYLLLNSPLAFRKRNIFIDSTVGQRV